VDSSLPEIIEVLERQRRFHQEQLRLIEIALTAIERDRKSGKPFRGKTHPGVKKHRIQWTREIDRLLDGYTEFTILDLQNDLVEKRGIVSARTVQGQNVVNNTLSRFQKKGRIQRVGPGRYRVLQKAPSKRK
jgi:hypothetical protein